jgi:hypothetical protein
MSSNATASFYLALNDSSRTAIGLATAEPAELGRAQQQIHELDSWRKLLSPRPDGIVLRHAINELTVGLFLLVAGLYRPAFVSLRLFLELSLAGIHFSVNRLELAEWLDGRRDIKWAELINEDNGVLSIRHADAFFPELRGTVRNYNSIGSKIYRELSEFVHGNHHTWGGATDQIIFDKDLQKRWLDHFFSATTIVNYALSLRFLKEINREGLNTISATVHDSLGHIDFIRNYIANIEE